MGTWARKIARQSNACVNTPPSAGPAAKPKIATAVHTRRRVPPASSSVNAPTSSAAPPSACTPRSTSSASIESATPQPAEATPNTSAPPAASVRAGRRTTSGSATASTNV